MPSETTIHVAIELSVSSWLVATRPPGAEKSRLHHIEGGDTTALLALIAELRTRASTKLGKPAEVVCCFEAGRDGFCPHREREHLVQERLRIENRIEALLFTQGIRKRPSLRSCERDLAKLRTGDGRALPSLLRVELDRLRRRLVLALELIREVEAEHAEALAVTAEDEMTQKIAALQRIRGIGTNFAAVLVREVLYRSFANRRQLASYVGITPMPYQSGGMDRDRSISRAGNPRARTSLIQLAWLWLRYQPGSALAAWFRERVGTLQGRTRRIAIVAMARKLLIALWRYVETGVIPDGVEIRAQTEVTA